MKNFGLIICTNILNTFLISLVMVEALRDVRVKIPPAVRRGDKVVLKCFYDIEGDTLYAVKWYKRGREFYRYTPKEKPAMKIFTQPGFRIERHSSNESQLTLDSVQIMASGKYTCEVSADAPSFHTLIGTGELNVVEIPNQRPIINGIRSRYRVGDSIRGNCSSRHSKPAANLTWVINEQEANPNHIRAHKPDKNGPNDLETSISSIQFVVAEHHFQRGKLKIRCRAHIHDIYSQSSEKSIEIDRAKQQSPNVNLIQGFLPYDQFALQDGSDSKDFHIQGDVSSLNSSSNVIQINKLPFILILPIFSLLLVYLINQKVNLININYLNTLNNL